MFGFALFTRSPRTVRKRHTASLAIEALESRLCPTGLYLETQVLPDHQVHLVGHLDASEADDFTVEFSGAYSGSVIPDANGFFSVIGSGASLGTVYAVASSPENTTYSTESLIWMNTPTVSLSIADVSGYVITMSGHVNDLDAPAETVHFGGIVNGSTSVDANGDFTFTTTFSSLGTIQASVTNLWDLTAAPAEVSLTTPSTVNLTVQVLPDHQVQLSGYVIGAFNDGATVQFGGAVTASATTDANGFFTYTTSEASLGLVSVVGLYQGQEITPVIYDTIEVAGPTITLSVVDVSGYVVTLSGHVNDLDAPSETVHFGGIVNGSTSVGANGDFTFTTTFSTLGAIQASVTNLWDLTTPAEVALTSTSSVTLEAQVLPGHQVQLSGYVVGAFSEGATVQFSGAVTASATTDANGYFTYTTSEAWLGLVSVVGIHQSQEFTPVAYDTIALVAPNVTLAITDMTDETVTVSGTLSSLDLNEQTITVSGASIGSVTTDEDGHFSFTLDRANLGTISVSETDLWGQTSNSADVDVANAPPFIRDFSAVRNAANLCTFTGRVIGNDVEGLLILLGGIPSLQDETVTVGSNGWFTFVKQLAEGETGTATAQATREGQTSSVAYALVS